MLSTKSNKFKTMEWRRRGECARFKISIFTQDSLVSSR